MATGMRDSTQLTFKSLQPKLTQKYLSRGNTQNDLIQNWGERHKKIGGKRWQFPESFQNSLWSDKLAAERNSSLRTAIAFTSCWIYESPRENQAPLRLSKK